MNDAADRLSVHAANMDQVLARWDFAQRNFVLKWNQHLGANLIRVECDGREKDDDVAIAFDLHFRVERDAA